MPTDRAWDRFLSGCHSAALLLTSAVFAAACGSFMDGEHESATVQLEEGSAANTAQMARGAGGAHLPRRTFIRIDTRRSLVATEQPILERFSFQRVMEQLVAQSGVAGLTPLKLFQQWWDTQNPKTDPEDTSPHCDDFVDEQNGTVLNGYPYLCRPAPSEGAQSTCDPFSDPDSPCAYIPVGLFNRFDMAPEDGSHCGEYRIVYAKKTGVAQPRDRNLVIFEPTMMNPHPQQGLNGCRKLVDVWADLTHEDDIQKRAAALERFYFYGHGNVPPAISIGHFGQNELGVGQVRSNQFVETETGWSLREYKLFRRCGAMSCATMHFVPQTDKTNAFGGLFDPTSTHANAAAFRAFFPSQVAGLAVGTLAGIDMGVPDAFNTGQSQASGITADEMKYLDRLGPEPSSLRSAISDELHRLDSSLTVDDIVLRAQATACAGCHRLSNNVDMGGGLIWPSALGFVHVSERELELIDGVTRFRTSDALNDLFLPLRKSVIEDYLNNKPRPSRGPKHPISGRRSHG